MKNWLLVVSLCAGPWAWADSVAPVSPVQVIDALEANGKHPGFRRNHAKGGCIEGNFVATKDAQALSKSFLFTGKRVPFIGRFSNPGPNLASADNSPSPRGLALQFRGPNGASSNMSMLNVPVFPVPTPEAFLESLKLKGPADIAAFQKKYPRSVPFFQFVGSHPAPESFATSNYHSLHAFKFTNGKGESQFVRWNFVAEADEKFLTKEALAEKGPNFLFDEMIGRAKAHPSWKMEAMLSQPVDSLVDPSVEWPADRKKVELGTLTITKASPGGPCVDTNFDPNQLAEGIESSEDPVLRFRTPAYALSFGKRMSEKGEEK